MTIHDLNLAAQYCNRLLLLDKGTLVTNSNVDKVLSPKVLSKVFGLPCYRDDAQHCGVPRVYFYPESGAADNNKMKPSNSSLDDIL